MKHQAALDHLIRHLACVAPDPGDRLPSERALTQILGCSRATLRIALAQLERDGEVWRHVGQGTFRGVRPRHLPLRDTLLIEGATPLDLMQARLVLEPAVAAAAARRATPQDVDFLIARVEAGRKGPDRSACEQADDAFHCGIAQVAGNPVLIGLLTYLSGTRRRAAWQRHWDRVYRSLGVDEFRTEHSDQHRDVVTAIAAHDEVAAANAMARHLQTILQAITLPN
ncbi:FCD domain-containing protein [Rhodobacteraceae bacterium KMM 6894]|nr:FCD domain-containing protein [Rhodobacteraceae bacterium KMM 6894]